jgi:hypothetical protein
MSERTRPRPSTDAIRRGRLNKAVEFRDGAILIDDDMPDAAVSLSVNAGVAAADVICGVRLGIRRG